MIIDGCIANDEAMRAEILASGTAIFKPGIQGTLVKATNRANSSMAWGVFYQTVNIGGFFGPIVAARMRSEFSELSPAHGWTMVSLFQRATPVKRGYLQAPFPLGRVSAKISDRFRRTFRPSTRRHLTIFAFRLEKLP